MPPKGSSLYPDSTCLLDTLAALITQDLEQQSLEYADKILSRMIVCKHRVRRPSGSVVGLKGERLSMAAYGEH